MPTYKDVDKARDKLYNLVRKKVSKILSEQKQTTRKKFTE